MDVQFGHIGIDDIDRALDSRWSCVAFSGVIERLYRRDAIAEHRKSVALNMLAALCLFDSFIANDYVVLRQAFPIFLVGRFLVATPLCLACALLVLRRETLYDLSIWTFGFVTAGTLSALLWLSAGSYRDNYLFGDVLIMVSSVALTRPRLPVAMASILAQCACFEFVVATTDIVSPDGRIVSLLFCMSAAIIAALTAYAIESVNRRAFLLKLRVQLLNRDLHAQAAIDPLTGLGNRRALEEATGRHWAAAPGAGRRVSLILIDIDFFKAFNDSHGHPAGDACLERLARCVMGEMRGGHDLAIRFGGEEIVVFLPDTELEQARLLAESIRRAILAAAIPHPVLGPDAVVTASLGVASSLTGRCTSTELVKRADIALYAAKHHGRNQVWPPADGVVTANAGPVPRHGAGVESLVA